MHLITQTNLDQMMQEAAASIEILWAFIFAWFIFISTLILFKQILKIKILLI